MSATEQQTKNCALLSPGSYDSMHCMTTKSAYVISHIYWKNAICETLGLAIEKELELDMVLLSNNVYNNKYSDDNGN